MISLANHSEMIPALVSNYLSPSDLLSARFVSRDWCTSIGNSGQWRRYGFAGRIGAARLSQDSAAAQETWEFCQTSLTQWRLESGVCEEVAQAIENLFAKAADERTADDLRDAWLDPKGKLCHLTGERLTLLYSDFAIVGLARGLIDLDAWDMISIDVCKIILSKEGLNLLAAGLTLEDAHRLEADLLRALACENGRHAFEKKWIDVSLALYFCAEDLTVLFSDNGRKLIDDGLVSAEELGMLYADDAELLRLVVSENGRAAINEELITISDISSLTADEVRILLSGDGMLALRQFSGFGSDAGEEFAVNLILDITYHLTNQGQLGALVSAHGRDFLSRLQRARGSAERKKELIRKFLDEVSVTGPTMASFTYANVSRKSRTS